VTRSGTKAQLEEGSMCVLGCPKSTYTLNLPFLVLAISI